MKRIFAYLSVVLSIGSAWAEDLLYATGSQGLYVVNPDTGSASLLWNLPGRFLHQGGLAYDRTSDKLYATGYDTTGKSVLWTINRFSGETTMIGYTGDDYLFSGGMSIHPITGQLYGAAMHDLQRSKFYAIDKATGVATHLGNASNQFTAINGIGFRSDGVLFGNGFFDYSVSGASDLLMLDLSGGTTLIGPHGVPGTGRLAYSGLAFRDDGTMLSLGSIDASTTGLYAVSQTTGTATLIGPTNSSIGALGGLAFAPGQPVPEPATFLAAGLGIAALLRRRKQR